MPENPESDVLEDDDDALDLTLPASDILEVVESDLTHPLSDILDDDVLGLRHVSDLNFAGFMKERQSG